MIKADQIPDEVVAVYVDAYYGKDLTRKAAIAAALNAWPGMGPIRTDQPIGDWCDKLPAIILPLPQESTNAEG